MSEFKLEIQVVPRPGILDPQGNAVGGALAALGFEEVSGVHVGRLVTLRLQAASEEEARERAETMCRQLLANPVTEDFHIRVAENAGSAS